MSLDQYNNLLSNMLKEKQALALLRAQLEGRRKRECWSYKKFRHLAHNYRNRNEEEKGKLTPQNRFEVLASRVIRYSIREKVKVRKQEMAEEVQCFRYRGIEHYKWECPNIKVEKERRRQEETVCPIRGKVQQQEEVRGIEPVCPNWKKVQEYCGVENVPENVQLLELG